MTESGALTCARYAFAPNWLHYCGPETHGELGVYVAQETTDRGLTAHLAEFETLYPYLQSIAAANGIADPFNRKVVEAYWVGNELLEQVDEKATAAALIDYQHLPKRLPKKELKWLLPKIDKRARLHHSFHVLNVFTRTGHRMIAHTVETMDSCRISWGEILQSSKLKVQNSPLRQGFEGQAKLKLKTQKLVYVEGKLKLIPAIKEVMVVQESLARKLKQGDFVSVHWGIVCDKLTSRQVKTLETYTQHHLKLANETI